MIETQSEKFFDVLNPADGTVVGRVPLAKRKQLDLAVEAAGQAFETWKMTSWKKRREICLAIAHKIKEHAEELARLLTLEQGKISGAIALDPLYGVPLFTGKDIAERQGRPR